ncbi:hypothetical protein MKZ38_006203 [Zalerion maritima]|uniref:alpha-1,2-Mannosidase n=1 Tax=Zalerion maritima TaxID=339359 RepID=A0AAD5RP63_9PEZI|nr:hypothetical protein MKZ38_006203 [Zalerion maritima]
MDLGGACWGLDFLRRPWNKTCLAIITSANTSIGPQGWKERPETAQLSTGQGASTDWYDRQLAGRDGNNGKNGKNGSLNYGQRPTTVLAFVTSLFVHFSRVPAVAKTDPSAFLWTPPAMAVPLQAFAKQRYVIPIGIVIVFFIFLHNSSWSSGIQYPSSSPHSPAKPPPVTGSDPGDGRFRWATVPLKHAIARDDMKTLPEADSSTVPRIQHAFGDEPSDRKQVRLQRLGAVKANFTHAWEGYKSRAWLQDEVKPVSGKGNNPFGGWAATLVDTLDTLWMMGLESEFKEAVREVEKIDFSKSALDEINVFETTIRYLGGFLAAYEISGQKYPALLRKAAEVGDMLYIAFDTPNHMPITRWKYKPAREGTAKQVAPEQILVAEIGSLGLEFTHLSQLTGDNKYYDAVQRVMDVFEDQQDKTNLPGMWPVVVNAATMDFTSDGGFTIGGMADSAYEYLPKMFLLLGGGDYQYRDMYVKALAAMKRHIFYEPTTQHPYNILIPGSVQSEGHDGVLDLETQPEAQHLGCFAGGMVGLGARAFGLEKDMSIAKSLVEGCLWGYESNPSGIMPEIMHTTICNKKERGDGDDRDRICKFSEDAWYEAIKKRHPDDNMPPAERASNERLVPGVTEFKDHRYILRPEAIESVFLLYRMTGETNLQDRAWDMFTNIVKHTQTNIAHAALGDIINPNPGSTKDDRMESFWLAETLKYFYLIYAEPDLVSLDEYVFNTEAHPLKWRTWKL